MEKWNIFSGSVSKEQLQFVLLGDKPVDEDAQAWRGGVLSQNSWDLLSSARCTSKLVIFFTRTGYKGLVLLLVIKIYFKVILNSLVYISTHFEVWTYIWV